MNMPSQWILINIYHKRRLFFTNATELTNTDTIYIVLLHYPGVYIQCIYIYIYCIQFIKNFYHYKQLLYYIFL